MEGDPFITADVFTGQKNPVGWQEDSHAGAERELSTATQHERPDATPARVTRTPAQLCHSYG